MIKFKNRNARYDFHSKCNTKKEEGMKYSEYLGEWLEKSVKPNVKDRTYKRYDSILIGHLYPKLGNLEMDQLTTDLIQNFIWELSQNYAANTVKGIVTVMKSSLVKAESLGIASVRIDRLELPKHHEKLVESFTASEQRKIEQYMTKSGKDKYIGILLCLYTGLRIGELLALEWRDIDFSKGVITVNKSCHDAWENGIYIKMIEPPKTNSSLRVIPLPKQLLPMLKAAKNESKSAFVVSGKDGKTVSVRSYQMTFDLLLKKLGLPHRGFHALRHTFATRALECGMDARTLAELMGHTNPTITLKRYAHSMMEHKQAMMNRLGKNFL